MSKSSQSISSTKSSVLDEDEPKSCCQKILKGLKDNLFTLFTLLGVIVGFGIGLGVGTTKPTAETIMWIEMPGKIYIRMLQLTILPIIAANIIVVMAGMDPRKNGKVGFASIGFIFGFDIISGFIGVMVAVLMQPGASVILESSNKTDPPSNEAPVTTSDVFADLFLNIFPDNIVGIAIYQSKSARYYINTSINNNTERVIHNLDTTDMIGLIFVSIMFGIAARKAELGGKIFIDFFKSISMIVLQLMRWFLKLTPIGVCFMVAGAVVGLENIGETFMQLGLFIGTVLVGLAIHMLLQMMVYTIASFRNPFVMLKIGIQAWFLSFITTAPLIAIPQMIETCDRYGIRKNISRFVIPLSAALKGDGSGVFQAVACVFIGQLNKHPMNIGTYVVIALLTGFGSLAIPNVPSSSIVIVITILSSLGINVGSVSLLFAVEWFMDRCRSGSIGYGHLYAAAFTHSVAVGRKTEFGPEEDEDENEFIDEYKSKSLDLESLTNAKIV